MKRERLAEVVVVAEAGKDGRGSKALQGCVRKGRED